MGIAKATLPFGPELLVQRLVRIVGEGASQVVIVAAPDQTLPALPAAATVARDRQPDRGPLEAIAAGLRSLGDVDAVFITACDTPLLMPAFIRTVLHLLDEQHDAAVPVVDGLPQPLSGAYRPRVLAVVEQMLAENQLKVRDLLPRIRVRQIAREELVSVDPTLQSLRNVNIEADYLAALADAGLANENR
jgi:molybdopterin-guanine dinucleotide biosynthesis protein A